MACPPSESVYLSDQSEKDKPWDTHRGQAETVMALYDLGGFERYAERIRECSNRLQFALKLNEQGDVVFKLFAARFCRVRFCPVCQWRRCLMLVARFLKAMPKYLGDYPKLVPLFLTLTVRNPPVEDLRDTIGEMNRAFTRMTQRKVWPGEGWIKSVEVSKPKTEGEAHPHFHCLVFVKPSYFKGKGYITQQGWRELWQDCLRADYLPVVNVKRVKSKKPASDDVIAGVAGGLVETLKYSIKPEDLVSSGDWLYAMTEQLHKTRAISIGGNLREYLKEDEPEDLINPDGEEVDIESDENTVKLIFDWATEVKRYAKTRQANH
jgi:plasmid rolling circle replication initiator protein Rep